jgi:hypothetical protein
MSTRDGWRRLARPRRGGLAEQSGDAAAAPGASRDPPARVP